MMAEHTNMRWWAWDGRVANVPLWRAGVPRRDGLNCSFEASAREPAHFRRRTEELVASLRDPLP
jgi:hypothetical protein